MNNKTEPKGVIFLFITAIIWGSSFVSQSIGMEKIDAFTFQGIRTLLGGITLLPFVLLSSISKKTGNASVGNTNSKRLSIKRGVLLGIVFFAATNLQQFAFYYSTSGKIAFITAIYMFFVPIIGLIFKKRIPLITWICIFLGFIGLYLLCINPNNEQHINEGDLLALACAFFFAIHILLVERFSPGADGVTLSCTQFLVSGTIASICMLIFETPNINNILDASVPLLYSGIMSCGIAYTFQIIGQKYTEATVASLIMCSESVFAVIAGAIILGEILSVREIAGCAVMFIAIILSQFNGVWDRQKN